MKAFQILVIMGGILIVIGLAVAYGSNASGKTDSTFIILAGYYDYISFSAFNGMKLVGDYAVTSDGTVDVHVFNQGSYDRYHNDGTVTGSLYDSSGSGSTFSLTFPSGGTWYFVLAHGSGFESSDQSVRVTMNKSGVDIVLLGTGIGLLVVGAALVAVGLMQKKKAVQAMPPAPAPTDVTYFQPPQPPTG